MLSRVVRTTIYDPNLWKKLGGSETTGIGWALVTTEQRIAARWDAQPSDGELRSALDALDADERGFVAYCFTEMLDVEAGFEKRLAAELGSSDFATRDRARRAAIGLGRTALGPLMNIRDRTANPEIRARVSTILERFERWEKRILDALLDRDVEFLARLIGSKDADVRTGAMARAHTILPGVTFDSAESLLAAWAKVKDERRFDGRRWVPKKSS